MFGRLLWKLLRNNRGRLAVALIAVTSGATVISALLNLQFDIERKLTQEFRALGPNIVISGKTGDASVELSEPHAAVISPELSLRNPVTGAEASNVAASAPFFFFVSQVEGTPVISAGTWLDQLAKLNPTWRIQGGWSASRDDGGTCLLGRTVAKRFGLGPGRSILLDYWQNHVELRVAGVIDSGTAEDNQIFISLPAAWKLTGRQDFISLWQFNVTGSGNTIEKYAARLAAAFPEYDVRPIRAVTQAEGSLLDRTRLLIALMVMLILALTALCVLATMMALAMERRRDVGLMKALGGSISRIVGLFLAEVGTLGAVGGLIGCVAGVVLARWMGERVFGASINARWDIFPLTIALMIGVALAGALPLRFLGKVKPAVILRGE